MLGAEIRGYIYLMLVLESWVNCFQIVHFCGMFSLMKETDEWD